MQKAQQRREKMAQFNAQVAAEKQRLAGLDLATPELIEQFDCDNFFAELAAAQLVQERDRGEAMPDLLAGLDHPKWKVRRTCADFMDHWGDDRCVEPLIRALQDPKENVRRLALHSLTCQQCKVCPLHGDFVPPLIELAKGDRSLRVRRIATGTLGGFLHDERVFAALQELAESSPDAIVATRALGMLERCNSS